MPGCSRTQCDRGGQRARGVPWAHWTQHHRLSPSINPCTLKDLTLSPPHFASHCSCLISTWHMRGQRVLRGAFKTKSIQWKCHWYIHINMETHGANCKTYCEIIFLSSDKTKIKMEYIFRSFQNVFLITWDICSTHLVSLRANQSWAGADGVLAAIFYSVRFIRHVGGCVN